MPQLPMIPGWDGMHPLIIHFPIVLFFIAPLFVGCAAATQAGKRNTLLTSALVVMVFGLASMYLAVGAGQSAAALVWESGDIRAILEHHQQLAGLSRGSLTLATLLFGLTLLTRAVFHLRTQELTAVLPLGWVVFYGLGLFWLINAAYYGERLVHEFGVGRVISP